MNTVKSLRCKITLLVGKRIQTWLKATTKNKQNKTIKQKQNENLNEDFTVQFYTQEYNMLISLLKKQGNVKIPTVNSTHANDKLK